MSTAAPILTVADLLHDLGDIPPQRVRMKPAPGLATLDDLFQQKNAHCELVDGTLVEKAMGHEESFLAMWLAMKLNMFVINHNLGTISGEQGLYELPDENVRGPDISFVSWSKYPNRKRTRDPIPFIAIDLVVEVLSPGNTLREMERKRREYFASGVSLVWEVDPRQRIVTIFDSVDHCEELAVGDTLTGGTVLPGFSQPLSELFAELDRHG
jgi:Uma2 family endonuclease